MTQKKKRKQTKKDFLETRLLEYKAAEAMLTWDMFQAIHEVLDDKETSYIQ